MSISKNLPGFAIRLIALSGILAGLSFLVLKLTTHHLAWAELVEIYTYLIVLTLLSFALVMQAGSKNYDRAGFVFLGLALVKLMLSFAFLWPKISSGGESAKPYLFHFFALYFLYLGFEAWQVVKVIQKADPNIGVTQYKDLDEDG